MAALYGECLIAYEEIMNNELDKFTRKGYDLFLVDEERRNTSLSLWAFK